MNENFVVQVRRKEPMFKERKKTKTYGADKKTEQYILKSRFNTMQARLNVKQGDKILASGGGLRKPVIGKALQQGTKYMRKGNQCLTKREIGARF